MASQNYTPTGLRGLARDVFQLGLKTQLSLQLLGAFARLPQATVDRCVKDVPEVSPHLVLSAVFKVFLLFP